MNDILELAIKEGFSRVKNKEMEEEILIIFL